MAKFKVQDPSELENLIKVVPQPTTPKYTGAVAKPGQDLTQYDQGLTMYDSPEARKELNYQNQTGWQAWGNALGQSLAEVTAGTLEGFGYLLDLEQHAKALFGMEQEFDNEFSKTMRQFKESVREEMPVFTDPNKPFDPLNSRWWASNLPSITSTLTLMIPAGAAVGALGKLGKVGKALTSTDKILGGLTSGRAITSGAISRVLESTMEAAGNADQVYKELISQGKSEEEARTEAGKVASNTYYANLPLMLSDMFEYSVLFRNKGVDAAVDSMNKQAKKSLLKNSLAVGGSFLSEGLEEGYQYGVGQEAKKSKNASETMGNVVSNFGEYFDDPEFLSSVVVGGMSGAGFQALGNVIESRSAKLANIFPEFDDTALQGLASSTGKSITALKTAGQAAFTKFKGNLQEALLNTEEAVKGFPEGQRLVLQAGLEALKQGGVNLDQFLKTAGTEDVPTLADGLWKGAKDKLKQGIDRIKKWSGINEEIQKLEASGNTPQAEILKKSEFVKLIEENTDQAEQYMTQAKDSGLDITEYEDILNTYKEAYIQHQGNSDAAKAEVQAKIRRQEKNTLQTEIMKAGTEYGDFDFNALRDQYLDREGSPEAKSLMSGNEPNTKANKTVLKTLKEKVKQFVDLELEELRLTKEADKLDTPKGQEELAAKKKEDKIAEIKKSSDPEVLFEAYKGEDEDVSKLAKSRIDKLIKEEFDVLPDPNIFDDVDKFKEFITTKDFPVLGLTKVDAAIDAALSHFYYTNRVEDKPTEETFEDTEFEKVGKDLTQEAEVNEGEPELETELGDWKGLNETIQENLELTGDFMLHSQLWSMSKGNSWWERKFNKVTQKDIDEGKYSQSELGNNKRNRTSYNDWTDDEIATEELFNNFGDPKDYDVYFEVQPKEWTDWKTGEKRTTNIYNHWIRVFVMKDGVKTYIGQLQDTEKTKNKELTNTPALQTLREKAEEELKTLKPGEKRVIGQTRIVNYSPGLYNNLAKPRDVKAALTDEELENVGIGVYMGEHEELALMKTNKPSVRNIKPVNAKPGSVYVAKKTPTGDWQWFACITKNLREMPELVAKVRELLAPFESTDPLELQLATREEKVRTTLAQLREIVRYRVNGKLEPDFNSKIVNVRAYHDENGKFSVDKFIEKHNLLDRKVQIDPKRLEEEGYVDSILDRLITDIDRIPFVNPFITVAPPDSKVLSEPVVPQVEEEVPVVISSEAKDIVKAKIESRERLLANAELQSQTKWVENGEFSLTGKFHHVGNKYIVEQSEDFTTKEFEGEPYIIVISTISPQVNKDGKVEKVAKVKLGQFNSKEDAESFMEKRNAKVQENIKQRKEEIEKLKASLTTQTVAPVKLKVSTKKKTFLLRTTQKPELYKGQIDIEKAVRELKRIVPNGYTVNVLKSLIESEGVSAYGMVHDAAITISEKAPYGTEYHEAWHAIEQVLPKFQYDRIKNYLTEEERADLFAEYEMTNQAPSILKRIFQLVKAFLQDLINYHPSLLDLFERANAGYYKNKKIGRYGTFYKIDGLTERNKADLVNVYLAEVGEFYDLSKKEVIETLIDSNPQQNGLTFIGDESPLISFIAKVAEVKGLDEANKLLAYFRPDASINEEGEIVTDGKPRMGTLYPELLKSLGKRGYKIVLGKTELNTTLTTERELEDGEAFEEPETDTLEGWQESASLRSPIEKLSKRMKQLIYSVRSDKQDSLGLGMNLTYNGYEAYSRLAAVIVDSIDVADMMEKISSRKDSFFKNLLSYIDEKFGNPINVYTELYKALGDKTQPEFWVTQEIIDPEEQIPGQPPVISIISFEANRASIKKRVENILGDYQGTSGEELLALLDMEDVFVNYKELETALKKPNEKKARFLAVWGLLKYKIYSKFISSHLSVDGKKTYEIINGGYFSKLTQRLQRDFEGIKAELFNKDPFLKELPILTDKPKAGDFQFVIYAGYKDADGNGLMYNNYTEKEFITSTFKAWMGKEKIHMMPILSDSPNLIGVRYRIPEGDREEMIAKIIHLEYNRSKDTHSIKNYNPEVRIFEQIPYKENMNEQILEVQKYFDTAETEYKEYAKQVGAQIQYKSNDNPNLVRSYLLEHAIVHSQMSMLSVGHLSFYKNLEDYYKRAKEIWSPVIKGNTDNYYKNARRKIPVVSKWQRIKVLPTVEAPSSQAAELESIGFKDYGKVDKTDAQTYIDLISYRDRMIVLNEWTEKHNVAFEQLVQGKIPTEDIVGLFNVLKPFYFNQHVVDGKLVSPVQKKDSELLILPIYGLEKINGQPNRLYNPLWKKHLEDMGYDFTTMSYDMKGRMRGKYFDIITYDTTMKVGMRSEMSIDLAKWGKQQETPEHHYMSDAIFGTQIMKLITGNLEGTYNVDGASVSAKALWKEYNELISQWTVDNFNKVVEEYGSEEKLKRMIIEEMINKGMRDDYIRSIQQLPLTHPIHFNKVIQIINSFAKNKITDITFDKGYTFANASSEGFSNELKIKWNNNDPKLGIDHFEVYAPIHDPRIKNYLVGGVVDMTALQLDIDRGYIPDLLTGLVYRIPTEGKYSMFKIKIVGFLPVDNGVMFMPDMVTKIAGLDFDIDKVRGFFFGGNKLQDRALSLMTAVLSSPASLKEQLTPGGFDNLKNNNLLIRAYKAGIDPEGKSNKELEGLLKDKMPFFSPITLSKIAKRMNTGKALIGVAANVNAVHSLMEAYSTFDVSGYNDYLDVVYNGENLDTLSRKYDTDGNLISANIAELLAAFVDNGKDPQAEYSNITSDTIGTALYLLKKGVPLKAVQFFTTQLTNIEDYSGVTLPYVKLNFDELTQTLIDPTSVETPYYNLYYSALKKSVSKFENYIAGVKVANAGAGATMVDNYLKIKKYKKAVGVNTSVIDDPGLSKTLIEKGLLEWNDFIVNTFKVPDVNTGTIVKALDLMTDHVLEYVSDKDVKDLYNSFITFVSSGYFKYDKTIVQDMGNADTLLKHKLANPTNKFLNRLEIKDGFLQFIGANTNDELEIQSIIDNWEELINSTDADTRKYGNDLIKYAFYQRGFDFGVGSFGHLIPVSYFIKNTEFSKYYVDTMRSLDQSNQEKANAFVEQFVANNYLDVKIPTVEGELDGEILTVPNLPSINDYIARYVKYKGIPFKYMGDGTYHQLPVRGKYVGTNKYLQRYDFNAKAKEFNSVPSEKKYVSQITNTVEQSLVNIDLENQIFTTREGKETPIIVPEGSSKTNLPIFITDDAVFLMNDQQQEAHDEIFKFVGEKLDDRSTDQSPLKISKLGSGSIPKGVYDNSIGLLGKGGTGKTSMLRILIGNIKKTRENGYNRVNVRYIAPTHTAATMLQEAMGFDSERTGYGVDTFASFVGRNQVKGSPDGIPENSDLLLLSDQKWLEAIELGQIKPVSEADIVVVDESSMISNTMIQNFMQRFNAEGGSKLPIFIFMGDYRQLPPVEETKEKFSEGVVSATIFANPDKYVELTQVMRSKDKELHRVYDSVGQQITQQRNQILAGQTPYKFDWKKYDDVTSKSTSNILITQERQVDQVIEDYTKQLVEQDNPYHIFWTHYNKLNHQRTQVLFNKIRNTYFKKLGVTDVKPGVMVNDYVQYTQSLPLPTLNGKYGDINVASGELKPGSRYKVKDLRKEAVNVSDISDTLLDYFGGVTMNMDKIYLVNRTDKLRYTMLFEKGAITAGTYNKETKTIPVTIRTSEGVSLTKDVAYRDFFSLKSYVASARKGIDGIFEPSYIGSTHTVQGASIKTIIVGDYNIRQNQGSVDMRDIESSLYTALTRSAGKLVIIKPNVVPIENNQEVFSYTLQTPKSVVPSQEKVMSKFDKKNFFTVTPIQAADQKAKVKASIATKYLGYAEGIEGSSTALYTKQAGSYANTGSYNPSDVVFVSIGGKRGNESVRKQQQDRTIKEAIQAIESGATLITDNKAYVNTSSYNEGEKRLAQNLESKGYVYSEITVENTLLGTWSKLTTQEKVMQPIQFEEEQSSGYRERTIKNASADATIALASDFTTAGEKLTKNSVEGQKKKYIPIDTKNLTVTSERVAGIVSRLNSVNAKTLNIAGNGIYSLPYTQEQVDEFTYQLLKAVIESPDLKNKIEFIRSGGQTGFDEAGVKAGRRLGIPTLVLAPKGWKFRNKQGQDVSNEQQFKARFDVQVPTQITMFEPIAFTQEMVDRLNEITEGKRKNGFVYTLEYLNNLPEETKERAIYCYTTGIIPGK